MRRFAVRFIVMLSVVGLASAQLTHSSHQLRLRPPAQECDCTGDCPPDGMAPTGAEHGTIVSFNVDASLLKSVLLSDPLTTSGLSFPLPSGASVRFSTDPSLSDPLVISEYGQVLAALDPKALSQKFAETEWSQTLSKPGLLGKASVDRVVLPGLRRSDFPVPETPRERELCRIAVRSSNSSDTTTCANAVAALCPFGTSDESCTIAGIRDAVKPPNGDPVRAAALLVYEDACLRSDLPARGATSFDFDMIAAHSGVIAVDISKAGGMCEIEAQKYAASDHVFCSGVAIGSDRVMTARHCFARESGGWNKLHSCIAQGAVNFATLSAPNAPLGVSSILDAATALTRTQVDNDYVVLQLAGPVPNVSGPLKRVTPVAFSQTVIVSYHDLAKPAPGVAGPTWRKKVRWALPACSFTRIVGDCGVTKCQTIEGYSGAPVWTTDGAGETGLAGLQVRGGAGSLLTCGAPMNALVDTSDFNLTIWGYVRDPVP